MNVTFRFEGGQELAAALAQLPARVSDRVQQEALTDAAEPIRVAAGRLAPRAPGAPDLADNIVISPLARRTDEFFERGAAGVKVGPSKGFFYGYFQEFGTIHHGPHAFMRPAFDGNIQKSLDILSRSLWRELAAKGISRSVRTDGGLDDSGSRGSEGLGAGSFQYRSRAL